VLSTHSYAYQLDGERYARLLRDDAEKRGVARIDGEVADVELRGEDGFIEAVRLADGRRIDGDLFIDCSGTNAILIGGALKADYEDWSHWLPCDRAVGVSCGRVGDPAPFTAAEAGEAGWRWTMPLQHADGLGLIYSSAHMSDEAALTALTTGAGAPLSEPRRLRFRNGRRKQAWGKNCVAIGASAACLEPLESTDLHLVQSGVTRLIGLFPDRSFNPAEAQEYNRLMAAELEQTRDLLILHYKATERTGAFWDGCRAMSVPETLEYRTKVFASRGRVIQHDDETFAEPSWISVFIGQNVRPRRYDPLADVADMEAVRTAMRRMRDTIRAAAGAMPTHRAFIEQVCSAPRGAP
jgi:tryptophan halogenase